MACSAPLENCPSPQLCVTPPSPCTEYQNDGRPALRLNKLVTFTASSSASGKCVFSVNSELSGVPSTLGASAWSVLGITCYGAGLHTGGRALGNRLELVGPESFWGPLGFHGPHFRKQCSLAQQRPCALCGSLLLLLDTEPSGVSFPFVLPMLCAVPGCVPTPGTSSTSA